MRALAIGVHTDDCEYGIGGILNLLAERGWEVEIFNLCPYKFSPQPEKDLIISKEAAKMLGAVKVAEIPKTKDFWKNSTEHAKEVENEINRFKPDIVFMQWFQDNHIEHVEMANATKDAIFACSVNGHRPEEIYAYETGPMQTMNYFQPEIYVNVTSVKDNVFNCLDYFGFGDAFVKEKDICSAFRGWQSRRPAFKYAECLKIIRYPRNSNKFMLVEALGENFSWCSPGKYCYGQKYLF